MGVGVRVSNQIHYPANYRVSESSTPLAGGDSSGGVGTIELDVPTKPSNRFLLEERVDFIDTARGSTLGTVRNISRSERPGMDSIQANSRLGEFMVEAQVQPFRGTLEAAFLYYCSIANIVGGVLVDDSIKTRQVTFPGWNGNLWVNMKAMATGVGAEINLVSNNVILRPVRQRLAVEGKDTDSSVEYDGSGLAQKQEVIWHETQYKANSLIYPPVNSTKKTEILSVNAGEEATLPLDIEASVFSVMQPIMKIFVGPNDNSESAFTAVGDDNLPIQPAQWAAFGGRLEVLIDPDTRGLSVKATGPSGLAQINGNPMKTYRLALSAGDSSSTYSTLRIVGDAIHLNERSIIIPTGVEPYRTAQEFAPTIQSDFINNLESAYSAGIRGARRYTGKVITLSSTVTAINRRGDKGEATFPPYSFVQSLWGNRTYGGVKTLNAGKKYSTVRAELYKLVESNFDNQLFGNAAGARIYNRGAARFFRIRDADTEYGTTTIRADDDLTLGDVQKKFAPRTYGQIKTAMAGKTYFKANLAGLDV